MAESLAAIVVYYARHRNDPGKDVHEATSYVVDERLLIGTFLNSDRTNAGQESLHYRAQTEYHLTWQSQATPARIFS